MPTRIQHVPFSLKSPFSPAGDQPEAIRQLIRNVEEGVKEQVLLGVTGSGKTYTLANAIATLNRPTLVIAHNKTLTAQLCSEFREFFPNNAVEYFVSYFDYYQPEAYIPQRDVYIEKDSAINDEIDRLRHSATRSLFSRRDVIVVASVSCIYGLGTPEDYLEAVRHYAVGQHVSMLTIMKELITIKYERNDIELLRGRFRVRGDVLEIAPSYEDIIIRIEFFGDEIDRITEVEPVSYNLVRSLPEVSVFPATHFLTFQDRLPRIINDISTELDIRVDELTREGKVIEAHRLKSRTLYDLEMIEEIGYCKGIENYSRHLEGRPAGAPPKTLVDYFPEDYLLIIDESHVTLPQVRGMYRGDYSRKKSLVDYGFRLPSAVDNRPLDFNEFMSRVNQVIYVSATPGDFELERSRRQGKSYIVEQIIRPTGLIDPEIVLLPTKNQIDHILGQIRQRAQKDERVLLVTLTKKMAEDLSEYLQENGVKVRYMHADVDTLERIEIIRDLRIGVFDVLVGINLLREGLDIPEVSMIGILDADKEGFLRNERTLIQIIGRAARNLNGIVYLYADRMTESMRRAIGETNRRRALQMDFNKQHGIVPRTVRKEVRAIYHRPKEEKARVQIDIPEFVHPDQMPQIIGKLRKEMLAAADELDFERAAIIRDRIHELERTNK